MVGISNFQHWEAPCPQCVILIKRSRQVRASVSARPIFYMFRTRFANLTCWCSTQWKLELEAVQLLGCELFLQDAETCPLLCLKSLNANSYIDQISKGLFVPGLANFLTNLFQIIFLVWHRAHVGAFSHGMCAKKFRLMRGCVRFLVHFSLRCQYITRYVIRIFSYSFRDIFRGYSRLLITNNIFQKTWLAEVVWHFYYLSVGLCMEFDRTFCQWPCNFFLMIWM